eukprot:6080132-Amphidinium_carterae.1
MSEISQKIKSVIRFVIRVTTKRNQRKVRMSLEVKSAREFNSCLGFCNMFDLWKFGALYWFRRKSSLFPRLFGNCASMRSGAPQLLCTAHRPFLCLGPPETPQKLEDPKKK